MNSFALRRGVVAALTVGLCWELAGCSRTPTTVDRTDKAPAPGARPPVKPAPPTGEKEFAYGIELKRDGKTERVREDFAFRSGDRFRLLLKPGFRAYVYLLNRGTGESQYTLLFPLPRETSENPLAANSEEPVPQDQKSWMLMNQKTGEENFVVVVSMVALPELTGHTSFSGDECERILAGVERQYRPQSSRRFEDGDWVKMFAADGGQDIAMILRLPLRHS